MALQLIDIGSSPNDGQGESVREAFDKCNDNSTELYAIKAQVNYTQITTASRAILDSELVLGHNIFGVNHAGAVAITLPANIDSNKLVIINDESGQAGANNITITVI